MDDPSGIHRYEGNTPSRKIWEIQCPKGDLDGNGAVNTFDIDPFVLALTNEQGYKNAFLGLDGSRIYHGNCNCLGGFDTFDIDAFTLRLTDPAAYQCRYGDCDPCLPKCPPGGEGGGDGLGAQAVAELYKKNVAPERLPYVIDAADFLAGWYKGTQRGEFWADVRAALVKQRRPVRDQWCPADVSLGARAGVRKGMSEWDRRWRACGRGARVGGERIPRAASVRVRTGAVR